MTKGLKIALAILGATAVVGTGIWLYRRNRNGFQNADGSVEGETKVVDPITDAGTIATSPESGSVGMPPETAPNEPSLAPETLPLGTFPIAYGDKNARVQQIQKTFSIATDGILGKQTRGALLQKGYKIPLSEADYNKVVSKKWYWGMPYKAPMQVYASNDVMIYAAPNSYGNKVLKKASTSPIGAFGAFVPEQIGWVAIAFVENGQSKKGFVSLAQKGLKIK